MYYNNSVLKTELTKYIRGGNGVKHLKIAYTDAAAAYLMFLADVKQ